MYSLVATWSEISEKCSKCGKVGRCSVIWQVTTIQPWARDGLIIGQFADFLGSKSVRTLPSTADMTRSMEGIFVATISQETKRVETMGEKQSVGCWDMVALRKCPASLVAAVWSAGVAAGKGRAGGEGRSTKQVNER